MAGLAVEDQIADKVANLINGGSFNFVGSAESVEDPLVAKETLDHLNLIVMEFGYTATEQNRNADAFEYRVSVGVRKNVTFDDILEVRDLKKYTQDIVDHLRHPDRRLLVLTGGLEAELVDIDTRQYRQELSENAVFFGMVSFTYRAVRESQ